MSTSEIMTRLRKSNHPALEVSCPVSWRLAQPGQWCKNKYWSGGRYGRMPGHLHLARKAAVKPEVTPGE